MALPKKHRLSSIVRASKFVLTASLVAGSVVGIGCSTAKPPAAATNPPTVIISTPITKEVTDFEDFVGQTAAEMTVEVRARVTGYLDTVHFKDGAEVEKDTILFDIDPRSYKADLAKAEAGVVQSVAHDKRLELDYVRAKSLVGRDVMPREEYDKIFGDLSEGKAAVESAKAARDLASLNVDFTKVRAPITGRLSRRLVDPGNLVKADDTMLTTIVSLEPMFVYFDIDERTMLKLRRLIEEGKVQSRTVAEVPIYGALADETDFTHRGTINFSENRIDTATGTLRVRAVMPNPESKRSPGLRVLSPGMFMKVRLPVGSSRMANLVPEEALGTDQGEKFIYVVLETEKEVEDPKTKAKTKVKQQVVAQKMVKVGNLYFKNLREVLSGVGPADRIITIGLQRVRPNVVVTPKYATSPTGANTAATDTTPSPPRIVPASSPTPGNAPTPPRTEADKKPASE